MEDRSLTKPELVLYKYDACPYCRYVMSALVDLKVPITYRDTRREPEARTTLIKVGGKSQVPCLFIDGVPLYESRDIVRFLKEYAQRYSSSGT